VSRVGEKLREARNKANMTQKALAKKLGVAEKYINEIELGRKVAQESFIDRASKALNVDLNDISMVVTDEDLQQEKKTLKNTAPKMSLKDVEKDEVWTNAFSSVIKNIPILDYSLNNKKGSKEMPIHSNKIEGISQDKALYIEIENDEMSGYRMLKGDLAFASLTKEIESNAIYLVDYKGKRAIRQIKDLGSSKVLLVSNNGNLLTETLEKKEVNVIAKIRRIEINL